MVSLRDEESEKHLKVQPSIKHSLTVTIKIILPKSINASKKRKPCLQRSMFVYQSFVHSLLESIIFILQQNISRKDQSWPLWYFFSTVCSGDLSSTDETVFFLEIGRVRSTEDMLLVYTDHSPAGCILASQLKLWTLLILITFICLHCSLNRNKQSKMKIIGESENIKNAMIVWKLLTDSIGIEKFNKN